MPTSVYPTTDGFVNVAASGNPIFARLCKAFGDVELSQHPDYSSPKLRSRNRVALNEAIARHTRRFTSEELVARLATAGVPCGPIYPMDQVFADAQVQHLEMATKVPSGKEGFKTLVGPAFKLSRTPAAMRHTVGPPGEHNDEILRSVGYSSAEIEDLRKAGVI
jgi:formyl-CoA transferase